ncbi:type II toxin-antitoxin system PemK/MazF family toxin [Sphingomonas sp. DT-204]|uniref:type II toxin-antitoxin system PemK/MazF family toxin n=1 Tax=Sphingomonas sp. DT-204 TaxID=3396166 RepID=UPI003F1E05A3
MRRGDVVIVRQPNTPAGKQRPCIVVQRDSTLSIANKVTVCPVTSTVRGPQGGRPLILPTPENGLARPSEVEIDWIYTFSLDRVLGTIGSLDEDMLRLVDEALRRWLDL